GLIAACLGEFTVGTERAEHLVGRDMVKAEGSAALQRQAAPIIERGFEQHIGALDIGLDERTRTVDRTVDMRLRREMHYRVGLEGAQHLRDERAVADIALVKAV